MRSKSKTARKASAKTKAPAKDSKEMAAMRNSVPKPKPGDRVRK